VMEVRWVAGSRHVPSWVRDLGIPIVEAPASAPKIGSSGFLVGEIRDAMSP